MNLLDGKKILFIGAVGGMSYSVRHSKDFGLISIVTDYYTDSQAKEYSDYAYDISTMDIDKLSELMDMYSPDGLFTGYSDNNLRTLSELSSRYNMFCYASPDQISILQDKNKFKSLCAQNNIPCPHKYFEDEKINFPVIVKPSDAYAAKGIMVCYDEKQLQVAIPNAKKISRNGEVVIEDYIEGDEVMIHYVMIDGHLKLTSILNRTIYEKFSNAGKNVAPIVISNKSKHIEKVLEYEKNFERMLKSIRVKNAVGFFQGIANDCTVMIFETAFRFGGNLSELFNYYENDVDIVGEFLKYSVLGKINADILKKINPRFKDYCTNITLFMREGKVKHIVGEKKLESIDIFKDVQRYVSIGDEIATDDVGTYKAMAYRIIVICDNPMQIIDIVQTIRKEVFVLDENGEDLIQWDKTIAELEKEM